MSAVRGHDPARLRRTGISDDVGEIATVPWQQPVAPITRAQLLPAEEAASLHPLKAAIPDPIAPMTKFLGPRLTVGNRAWTGDPVPAMRALETRLVEHALSLPENERGACMDAIAAVEMAVLLRLRFQQMRMTPEELGARPEAAEEA